MGRVLPDGLFGLIVAGFVLFSTGLSFSADIGEINRAIQKRGLKWVAGETPLSHLTAEEIKGWTGAKEEPDTGMAAEPSVYAAVPLAASLDWTDNGGNYVTGVRNQGGCGSCWAFATTAALESKALITFNTPNADLDLSEQIVLSCTDSLKPRGDPGTNNCDGGYASSAADVLKDYGTALETCYPYTQANGSCGSACANWQNEAYKIAGWNYVVNGSSASASAIKAALQSGPVVGWMRVYEDFLSYQSGVYARTSTDFAGNHFILIVGYDDVKEAFKIKNSWGTGWGQSGFGWVSYDELNPGSGPNSHTQFGRWVYAFGNAVHNGQTPQCDIAMGFDVTLSGKRTADGYDSSSFTTGTVYFDICATAQGDTLDSFVGYLYDNTHDYWEVSGTIVWNPSFTSAYIQGTSNADGIASFIDGTLRYLRGKYSLSAKGGCSDSASFVESYSSIKGTGDKAAGGDSLRDRKRAIQGSDRVVKSKRLFN
jgi:C1A family cysteine protease